MKNRSLMKTGRAADFGLRRVLRTGEHCPVSGWWAVASEPKAARFISEGSVMPAHNGIAVAWKRAIQPIL
ncbi:hypothetical protein FDW83_17660 [Pseudarthrobacter sp. NamE2]|nr:hypothetical protein FDW83_17660 [Pseudarthrobacter sp. NamE2]